MSGTNYQRAETFSSRDNYGIAFILKEILRAILSTRDVLVGINKKTSNEGTVPQVSKLLRFTETQVWTKPAGVDGFTLTLEEGTVVVNDGTTITTVSISPSSFSWSGYSFSNSFTVTGNTGSIFYINYIQ